MGFFSDDKYVTVYSAQHGAKQWEQAQAVLKEAGLTFKKGHYEKELPVGGCGCKLDLRNFGPRGKIDREVYYLDVPEGEEYKAVDLLDTAGIDGLVIPKFKK